MYAHIRSRRQQMQKEWQEKCEKLEYIGEITKEEVDKHNTPEDRWIILDGWVYNITQYLSAHPGGPKCLIDPSPNDISQRFHAVHRGMDTSFLKKLRIGRLARRKPRPQPQEEEDKKEEEKNEA